MRMIIAYCPILAIMHIVCGAAHPDKAYKVILGFTIFVDSIIGSSTANSSYKPSSSVVSHSRISNCA